MFDGTIHPAGPIGDGLAGWWCDWDGALYRGRAVVPADWTEAQVREAIDRKATLWGESVLKGRLHSRVRIDVEWDLDAHARLNGR